MSVRSRLAELFPWPFVGVVVLLVILIFLTPNLVSSGAPAAGSLAAEAQLVVDRVAGSNVTHLYVKSIGNVRYASISLELGSNVSWPVLPTERIHWGIPTVWNDSLEAAVATTGAPLAVNVSVVYVDTSGTAVDYFGAYAFNVSADVLTGTSLTPGLGDVPPTPVASLPIFLLLASQPAQAVP